ncbi:hypothetical protein [Sulfuricurvum sp.]|uniref:hypothetical protein n=1 Tax=Sulfuricurvum sp. TaxID=2025608 RepID=UPI00262EA0AE|nr:hypothetical protein [Sulfuricurvum sp.]MDD3597176.1 hypothetical protein [Sulfuricurvum sp.]
MSFDILAKLLAPVITAIISYFIKKYFEAKPKLIIYLVHASAIPLKGDEQGTIVNTHSVVVRNAGQKTANNVRIGHDILPESFQLFPKLPYEKVQGSENSAEILIPSLVPNEQVTISYLYFPPLTWQSINTYCKSDEAFAKIINIVPMQQPTFLQKATIYSLMFIGATTIVYWVVLWTLKWIQQVA